MADIRKCENIVSISMKCKEDYKNMHAILDYCMSEKMVFEYLQNRYGTDFAIVVGENSQLKEVLEICMGKHLEARICPNKAYVDDMEGNPF